MPVKQNDYEGATAQNPSRESTSRYQQLKSMNLEVLGERIRRARVEKKISQRDLSSGLFTSAYLSSLELGKTRPTLNTLDQLANLLGKSTDYFLRPTGGQTLDDTLDEEQARALELRQGLLAAQVYLEKAADDQAYQTLEQVSLGLSRLSQPDRARYHYLLGKYYNQLGNSQEALLALQEAQQYQGETEYLNPEQELAALIEYELGEANSQSHQVMNALTHYTQGLEALTDNSNPNLRWKLLAGAANSYHQLNDLDQAQAYFQQALDLAADTTLARQADYFYKRAATLSEQGDFQRASLFFGRSIQIYEAKEEQVLLQKTCLSLAQLQVQAKEYQAAEQAAQLALKLAAQINGADRCQELNALVLLATIRHRQADLEGASSYLERASQLQEANGCQEIALLGQYYQVAAELKSDQGQREASEEFYQKAIDTLNQLQTGDNTAPGRLLAEVYYSYGRRLKDWNETQKSLDLMERAYRLSTGKGRGGS
jgi:tetratricopeptide (TPR) repeat protein